MLGLKHTGICKSWPGTPNSEFQIQKINKIEETGFGYWQIRPDSRHPRVTHPWSIWLRQPCQRAFLNLFKAEEDEKKRWLMSKTAYFTTQVLPQATLPTHHDHARYYSLFLKIYYYHPFLIASYNESPIKQNRYLSLPEWGVSWARD